MMERAAQFLIESQNPDGGWGYRVRGMSFVEPTAAAMVALRGLDQASTKRGRDFLVSLQHPDGGWGIAGMDSESGWMTAWALIALVENAEAGGSVERGAIWLTGTQNMRVTDPGLRQSVEKAFQIDSTLRGWPWQPGDAAWVHPTALAILALVATGRRDEARPGIEYLLDRAVSSGGWNIGNPWMIEKPIPPTIHDTAIALRAIRAMDAADNSRVTQAILYLREALLLAKTAAELAWGTYALREWELDTKALLVRLNSLQATDGGWNGNPFITSIAMLAQPST
jgi:squalene cyclase